MDVFESYLGVKRTTFSFVERWSQCPPKEAGGKPLKQFLSKVSFPEILNPQIFSAAQSGYNPFFYDGYHEYDQFREDYRRTFGKEPYVGPYMRFRWSVEVVSTFTETDKEAGIMVQRLQKKSVILDLPSSKSSVTG